MPAHQPRRRFHTVVDDAWLGAQGCVFSGRLTHARAAPAEEAGRWRSLRRTTRMLLTAGAVGEVALSVGSHRWTTRADARGYWQHVAPAPLPLAAGWHDISADPAASTPAGLLVPDARNAFGIISDVDDTILVTHVLSKRDLLANSLTLPAEKRMCVDGMPDLYRRLLQQNAAPESSPVFYISSSPRQLTDNLRRFLHSHGFPRGVLQLRQIVSKRREPERDHTTYKCARIESVLASYPNVRFALFGDDGETDPEVYASIQALRPRQVAGIYIRRVHPNPSRPRYPDHLDTGELLARLQ
ncbi:hypothetical protein DB347_15290 [Opitutaceae bacterium EW11]|nr:hypothetical protein DB347_15290 [Opitutaceae bacterium EW11]